MNTDYRQIVAVTGLPGLYQLVSTKNDGAIVKNLADKTIKFVSARKHQVTPLESIEIYTTSDNIRLHEVFEKMKSDDADVPELSSKKDNEANKAYFKRILPDYDADRVYTSDIHKVIKWYAILKSNDLLNFDYLKAESAAQDAGSVDEGAEAGTDQPASTIDEQLEAHTVSEKKAPKAKAKTAGDEEKPAAAPSKTKAKKTVADKEAAAAGSEKAEKAEKASTKKAAPKKKAADATAPAAPKKTAARKKKEEDQ